MADEATQLDWLTSTDADAALDAVGHPSRRAMLRLLRNGEQTVREITDAVPVTQSAVSQHLRVLREAGLVSVRAEGTRRLYAVDLDGLSTVRAWLDSFWDDVLANFVEFAESPAREEAAREEAAPSPADGRTTSGDAATDNAPDSTTATATDHATETTTDKEPT